MAPSARTQLNRFMARYRPAIASLARTVLAKIRARTPGAVEMVYDNYNALVIGFCPNERPSDAVFSVVLYPRWVTLCFLQNATDLPDPHRLLRGSGKIVRTIRLHAASDLEQPAVQALITDALARADPPLDPTRRRTLVIRSISPKQRPRR
jgi:hypothetical protein